MKYPNFILLSCIFASVYINATDFLITVSGHYELGTNLPGNGDSNGTIRIQASYVTLDLGNYTVFQGDSAANATGIVVDPNLTNVVIQNGTISGFTKNGIQLGANCNKVNISNMLIENCTTFSGGSALGATSCSNLSIENVLVTACVNKGFEFISCNNLFITNFKGISCGIVSDLGTNINGLFRLISCTNLNANNLIFNSNFTNLNISQSNLVEISSCTNCTFDKIFIEANDASGAGEVLLINNSSYCKFSNFNFLNNAFSGFLVSLISSNNNSFHNILMEKKSNIIDDAVSAFSITSNSSYNIFSNCKISGFSTSGVIDMRIFDIESNSNVFMDCIVQNMNITGGLAAGSGMVGFYVNASYNKFIRCMVSDFTAVTTGVGPSGDGYVAGIQILGNYNIIESCLFSRMNASYDVNSYGIYNTGLGNLFIQNVAFSNGPTSPLVGNQLYGVPVGSFVAPGGTGSSASLNEVSSVLYNAAIIG